MYSRQFCISILFCFHSDMKLYRCASLLCLLVLMAGLCQGQDDLEDDEEENIGDEEIVDVEDDDDPIQTETVVKERVIITT